MTRFDRIFRWIFCGLICVLLVGCWDRREVDELAIILTMGVDAKKDGKYTVTFELADPGGVEVGPQRPGGGQGSLAITAQGRSLLEAVRGLQRRSSREIFLPHVRTILWGEELALDGLSSAVDLFERHDELRRTMYIAVVKGKAQEAMQATPQVSGIVGMGLNRLMNRLKSEGVQPVIFGDFLEMLTDPAKSASVPALVRSDSGLQLELVGTAVFKGDRLAGYLDIPESIGLSLILGRPITDTVLIVSDEKFTDGQEASLVITGNAAELEIQLEDGRIVATVHATIHSRMQEQMAGAALTSVEGWHTIEAIMSDTIEKYMRSTVSKTQTWSTDILGVGASLRRAYPKQWREVAPRWNEIFPEVEFRYKINSIMNHAGARKQPVTIRSGGD